jgi:DNA-binding transcriptional regulator YdaS (Cro superfamily)
MNRAIKKAVMYAGSQSNLAEAIGLSQGMISAYQLGRHRVDGRIALKIEKAVDRKVMRHELCPDVFKDYVYQPQS